MRTLTYSNVVAYDEEHESDWIEALQKVCEYYAAPGHSSTVFKQFKTDWLSVDLRFAMLQTLLYVGYGYRDAMVFKAIGGVIGPMLRTIKEL